MNTVFTSKDLPKCNLVANVTVTEDAFMSIDDSINFIRRNISDKLAHTICENTKYLKFDKVPGFINIRASIFVLTEEDLHAFALEKFKEGVKHAQGFRLEEYDDGTKNW